MRVLRSALLISLSVLFALILILVIDVVYTLATAPEADTDPYAREPDGWYQLRAGFQGHEQFGPHRFEVFTDANGYRTGHPETQPPDDTATTLFLGDSFTFGINGPWEDTFVGMYAAAAPGRVINAGVASYSPTAYLHHYRGALELGVLAPEHRVIVGLDISDIQDEAAIWTDGPGMPQRYSAMRKSRLDHWFDRTFPDGLRLWGMVEDGLKALSAPAPDAPDGTDEVAAAMAAIDRSAFTHRDWDALAGAYAPLGVQGGLDRTTAKLAELSTLARTNGGEVWLLIYPWPAQLVHDSTHLDWQAYASTLCAKIACAGVIDAFPVFTAQRDSDPDWYAQLFLPGDVHYNAAGNALIYEALMRVVPPMPQ